IGRLCSLSRVVRRAYSGPGTAHGENGPCRFPSRYCEYRVMPNDLFLTRTPRREGGWSLLAWIVGGVVMIAGAVALWSDAGLSALPPATPLAEEVQGLGVVASAQAAPFVPLAARSERFTIELGVLFTDADAERVERQLNEAGYQTVRFRQDPHGASAY